MFPENPDVINVRNIPKIPNWLEEKSPTKQREYLLSLIAVVFSSLNNNGIATVDIHAPPSYNIVRFCPGSSLLGWLFVSWLPRNPA